MSLEMICKSTEKNSISLELKQRKQNLYVQPCIFTLSTRIQLLASVIQMQILNSESQLQKNASAPKRFSAAPLTAAGVAGLSDTLLAAELNICSRRP